MINNEKCAKEFKGNHLLYTGVKFKSIVVVAETTLSAITVVFSV